ncbi:MAG: N-acetylmuramoyl-L-alanine amidase [Phycisphaerales bacterium]|nr:N-acetylmuramoyl-L-alanine amidase [Hyphomonadaceae bacterium]
MDLNRRSLMFAGATALGSVALTGRAWGDAPAAVRGVLVHESGQAVRVTVALERAAQARTFFLSDPDRFVVDLSNCTLALPQGAAGEGPGAGVVRRFRYAARPENAARLVFDLEAPARLLRQELGGRRAPELSFDLAPTAPLAAAPAPSRSQRRTIVVDAGHGGRDPGAIGTTGVREKDVVLDAALQLRQALESRGQYRVALTRDADRYVELEDRLRFARAQNADLFISIHADSHANSEAQGASVYTISERGETRAQNMAQNWDIDLGGASRTGGVQDILLDLYQRETTNRSAQFAQQVIPRLGAVAPLLRNTHRNAGFYVLLAPDVPAVLIETGFLSNVTDERRLCDPRARQAMAEAMAQAVDTYFAAPQLMAARA